MLAGNTGFIPITPAMYFAGDGTTTPSTAINKMPYATETFSTLSATLTFTRAYTTLFNSASHGYAIGQPTINKFYFVTDTNASFSGSLYPLGAYMAGTVPNVSALFIDYNGSDPSTSTRIRIWAFSNDTTTTSSALSSSYNSSIGNYNTYALSTNGTNIYFGGGTPAGAYIYGGVVKYNSSTDTATTIYTDNSSRSRSYASGINNGSSVGYVAGGATMPYVTVTASILKLVYSTETMSTISATLTVARQPARAGTQPGFCAYYASGRNSGSSLATISTTVDRLTFSNETVALVSTATVNRDGIASWNVTQ